MKQTFPFFLGTIYVGAANSELFLRFKIPMFTNLLTSVFRVSSCTFGLCKPIGHGFAWYG